MQKASLKPILAALAVAMLLSACAAPPKPPRVLWPAPPDRTYLEFVGAYYSQDNFEKTGFQLFMEGFFGKPDPIVFSMPTGIAADGHGAVYVADGGIGNVRIYDFNAKTVDLLTKQPILKRPFGMAIDSAGRLYAADPAGEKVMVFAPDRSPLFAIGDADTVTRPAYLALNERLGRLYVSDGFQHRIAVFDLNGKHLFSFGQPGNGEGYLYAPQGLAIDRQDRVFVAEQLNARVSVFDAEGKFLYLFGERGDREWQFEAPRDLAFDSDGNLHIVDIRKGALMAFSPEGTPLLYTGGGDNRSPVSFASPNAIFIDRNDTIYVSDALNRRFSVWQFFSEAYLARHPQDRAPKP